MEYKIPRILWENLESVLRAQSERYVIELARRLRVPEKELLKRVLPSTDRIGVVIQDSNADTLQCCAYEQQDAITALCRRPVAYQSPYCPIHRLHRITVIEGTNPMSVQRLTDHPMRAPMWIREGHMLIDSSGGIVGAIRPREGRLRLFRIDPT
jgi:hypothetical protein